VTGKKYPAEKGRKTNMELEINITDLPRALAHQLAIYAQRQSLSQEQRRLMRAIATLQRYGIKAEEPKLELPQRLIINL